jgi:uncharacterized integral membrane protein
MEQLLQRMSESDRTKAILSIVLSGISLVLLLLVFHLNFQQHQMAVFSATVNPDAYLLDQIE